MDADLYGEDRWNIGRRYRVPLKKMLMMYVGVIAGTYATFELFQHLRLAPVRRMPADFACDGRKHYSFELEPK